jgi:hypothetical protein
MNAAATATCAAVPQRPALIVTLKPANKRSFPTTVPQAAKAGGLCRSVP